MSVHGVVLAGGSGRRLWPVSIPERPKQLQAIFSRKPLVSLAVDRAISVAGIERTWVVTDERYASEVRRLVDPVAHDHVLVEPSAGGTLGAIALAGAAIASADPVATVVVLPSDHICRTEALLAEAVSLVVSHVGANQIGLIATPTSQVNPHLGHVRAGQVKAQTKDVSLAVVDRYIEKPSNDDALGMGHWLRNMGIVVAKVPLLAKAIGSARWSLATQLAAGADIDPSAWTALGIKRFEDVVLPRAPEMLVAQAEIVWADIGTWPTVFDSVPDTDGRENRVCGDVQLVDTRACVAIATDRPVMLLGLDDVLVVSTPDRVVVCARSHLGQLIPPPTLP